MKIFCTKTAISIARICSEKVPSDIRTVCQGGPSVERAHPESSLLCKMMDGCLLAGAAETAAVEARSAGSGAASGGRTHHCPEVYHGTARHECGAGAGGAGSQTAGQCLARVTSCYCDVFPRSPLHIQFTLNLTSVSSCPNLPSQDLFSDVVVLYWCFFFF